MSFGSGAFGFGQNNNNNNNNNQSSGFGGFGAANNTNTAGTFGTGSSSFGQQNNTGNTMFGNNNATGGFGSGTGGGFGSSTGGAFGAKPAFGSTNTGGGLFGNSANNSTANNATTFGGFGSGTNNTTNTAFGGGTATSGGLFGASKPTGFGTSGSTGTSLFGGTNTAAPTSTPFGTTGAFGTTAAVGDPPGTAITPFQAFTEKEPSSNTTNAFQNLCFQDPYKKWSGEELRLTDYAQGRRHGNASGAGAFGVSSGFGGSGFAANTQQQPAASAFGSTPNSNTGGLFGNANNNNNSATAGSTGFGQPAAGAFSGGTTGGGLFGQNKPGGGLFGASNTQNQQSGGLFGGNTGGFGSANTGGGFGTANNASSGGLFGNNSQAKPQGTGFSFGNANNTTAGASFGGTTGTAFGSTNNNNATTGGLFGGNNNQSTGGGLFGNNQQPQQQNTTPAFGQQNQTQQTGGLFGNSQQKPASGGLFGTGTANTGGGLFGTSNTQQNTTGAFGSGGATTGGLFGGNKPATGGGLFGTSNTAPANTTGGTGLFGNLNTTNQQSTGGGLFGSSNNQQAKPGGLFGASTQPATGGLFGGQAAQNQGSSLFGGSQQQNQNSNNLGSSLFGTSQQPQNAPQGLTANLNDVSAYGAPALFAGLGGNEIVDPGPLATPLNGGSKPPRRSSVLPLYKLAPASASRYATPQKRGFGFSYSSYGTPGGSPASISSTPGGLGRSLLGSSSTGSLGKSMSTNNLRRAFNTEDSILAPGAFSASGGGRWYGSTGSKKLVINREIRSDLFSTPQKDRQSIENGSGRKLAKRVSFDTSNVESDDGNTVRGALPAPEQPTGAESDDTPRQTKPTTNVSDSNLPEVDAPKGNELAIVHEEDNAASSGQHHNHGFDNAPGKYWIKPSMEDLQSMNRVQRQKVPHFTVGRDNIGYVSFKDPVDLSGIDLDEICGGIIQLSPRSATVYPVAAKKPPVGKGLNVPATIALEQSWPRNTKDKRISSDPRRYEKHITRLKQIPNTKFESYDRDTGVWKFSVEHFTTYGLDDSDDETDLDIDHAETDVSSSRDVSAHDMAIHTSNNIIKADTSYMELKRGRALPGAFDEEDIYDEEGPQPGSFLGNSSVDSAPNDVRLSLEVEQPLDMGEEYDLSEDEDMTRSSVGQHHAAELQEASSEDDMDIKRSTPGGILRARMRAVKDSVGPLSLEVADGDDWAEMLRKTVSPIKRDRQLLRELNGSPLRSGADLFGHLEDEVSPKKSSILGKNLTKTVRSDAIGAGAKVLEQDRGFATSIDLMNALFEKPKIVRENQRDLVPSKGFPEWPYDRQDKSINVETSGRATYDVARATWGPDGTLVVTRPLDDRQFRRSLRDRSDMLNFQKALVQTDRQELRLAKLAAQSSKKYLRSQDKFTEIRMDRDVPVATVHAPKIKDLFHNLDMADAATLHEKRVWSLASILFDHQGSEDAIEDEQDERKSNLSEFWTELVDQASSTAVGLAGSSEEKAVSCLAGHRVTEACRHLLDGKNFRLGTLVPLIGTSDAAKKDMKEQLKAWLDSKMLSEFSDSIRTICELLSGNACVCEGLKGVPVEDRMESFVISKKFGLDWRQAFGLRLWYAINENEDAKVAVHKFQADIEQDRESLPSPWYVEHGIEPLWEIADTTKRQDLLWGLLQLYADSKTDLEAILRPVNSQLSPFDMRLCWQLGEALLSTGKVSYKHNGADAVTLAYAAQLTGSDEWLEAVFVLLHLRDRAARKRAIQEHLALHAGLIGPDTGSNFTILTEKFLIPATWVWESLALYMRSVKKDALAEVQCLLRAGSFDEAHRVLVGHVAPRAVVERDYAALSSLIAQFQGRHDAIAQWPSGGEIYGCFLTLIQHRGKGESIPSALLEHLLAGLNSMSESSSQTEILQYAAISDMADETAKEILKMAQKKQDMELRSRVLHLPLTQDRMLAYSVDYGLDRFREVISH